MYALFWILIVGLISYFPFQHLWQLPISLKNELTVLLLTSNLGSQMVPQLCWTIVLINAFPALHKPLVASYPDSSPHKANPLAYLFTAASSNIICAQISQKLLLLLSPRLIKTLPFFSCAIFEQCSGMVYSFNVPWTLSNIWTTIWFQSKKSTTLHWNFEQYYRYICMFLLMHPKHLK